MRLKKLIKLIEPFRGSSITPSVTYDLLYMVTEVCEEKMIEVG